MTTIVFVLMLITPAPSVHATEGRREVAAYTTSDACLDLRDTLNYVRSAPGRYACFIATKKDRL